MSEQYYGKDYAGNPPANYESFFVPTIGAPMAKELVTEVAPRPGERVLDVACGTGVVAKLAAREVGATGSVVGQDVNPGMLAVARTTSPPDASIDWRASDAASMPFPDDSFDVETCQMGIQFMPDKPAALREMRRVLAQGGRLALNVPGPTPRMFAIMADGLARHVAEEAAGFVKQVFSLHEEAEIQELLKDAGFHDVSVQAGTKKLRLPPPAEFLWQYVHSTPLAGAVAKLDERRRGALQEDIVGRWQEFMKDGAMELHVRMVTATARN
jgi:ubiquinone/menaquinone biosynthesis C-methylase UbiE